MLVREGDSDDHLYVVASGGSRVVKAAGTDNEVTLNVLRPGDVVGELSFLDGAHALRLAGRAETTRACSA